MRGSWLDTSKESVRGVGYGALGSGGNVRGYRNTPISKRFENKEQENVEESQS